MKTIVEAIAVRAQQSPDHTAINVGKSSFTYDQLWATIRKAASAFKYLPSQEIVVLAAEKNIEFISYYFAAHLCGIACCVVDPKASDDTVSRVAEVLPVSAYFSSKGTHAKIASKSYSLSENSDCLDWCFPLPDAVADYMFTTGTTGSSKCVPLTHANLFAAASNINAFIGNTCSDHELIALPLCHSFGLGRLRCAMLAGGTCTIIPNFANERKLLNLIESENISGFSMVPAAWQYIRYLCADRFIQAAQHLRFIEIGSAALPLEDKEFLELQLPDTRICMHYGLTEASRSSFIEFHKDKAKLSSCGKAAPGVEMAIIAADGTHMAIGEPGEVCVRGQHVTSGYLNIPRESCFHGNFFRTGDVGMLDAEGYLHLLGRLKELINVGGKKVSPDEVEHILNSLPQITESACVAAPDPEDILGEVVKAYIVPKPDDKIDIIALQKTLRTMLEPHKVPRLIELRNTPIPRTESGKIQRQKLNG